MQDNRLLERLNSEIKEERAAAVRELERDGEISGRENSLLEAAMNLRLDSGEGKALCMVICPKLWQETIIDTNYTFDKEKLLKLSAKVLAESDNLVLRTGAISYLMEEARWGYDIPVLSGWEIADNLLISWEKAERPLECFFLAFKSANQNVRYDTMIVDLLKSDFPWKYSLSALLMEKDTFNDYEGPGRKKILKITRAFLLGKQANSSVSYACKLLALFKIVEIDEIVLALFKKKGHTATYTVSKCILGEKYGLFPKTVSYLLDQAIAEKSLRQFPDNMKLEVDAIVDSNLGGKFNRLIEILPPVELNWLLKNIKELNHTMWPGLVESLRKRLDEKVIGDIVGQFLLKIGKIANPGSLLESQARYGSKLNNNFGSLTDDYARISIHESEKVDLTDNVVDQLILWLTEGEWYQKDFSCRLLAGMSREGARNEKLKNAIRDNITSLKGIDDSTDLNMVKMAAELKIFEAAPLLVIGIERYAEYESAELLMDLYRINRYDHQQEFEGNEPPFFGEVQEELNKLLASHGTYIPSWVELSVRFRLDSALPFLESRLKVEIEHGTSPEVFDLIYSLKNTEAVTWAENLVSDAETCNIQAKTLKSIIKAVMDENSKFMMVARLIPAFETLLLPVAEYVLSTGQHLDDAIELFKSMPYLGNSRTARHFTENYLSLSMKPDIFSTLLEKLDHSAVTMALRAEAEKVLTEEKNLPILKQNHRFKDRFRTEEGGTEIVNLVALLHGASVPECAPFMEWITERVEHLFSSELLIVRTVLGSPELYEDLSDEEKQSIDTTGLLWTCILLGRFLCGLKSPSQKDPDPDTGKDIVRMMVFIEEWAGMEGDSLKNIWKLYMKRKFKIVMEDISNPVQIIQITHLPVKDILPAILSNDRETDLIELYAEILENLIDLKIIEALEGKGYLFVIDFEQKLEDKKEIKEMENTGLDFDTFCKIAMYLKIEYDEGDTFLARVGKEKTIETVAKLISEGDGDSLMFYAKEI